MKSLLNHNTGSRILVAFLLASLSASIVISAAFPSVEQEKSIALENRALKYLTADQPEQAAAAFSAVIGSINYESAWKKYESIVPTEHNEGLDQLFRLAEAYNCRGIAYGELSRNKEAMTDFNHALSLHPQFTQCLTNRGILNSREGRLQEALKDLSYAIELNPRLGDGYEARANVYTKLHDFRQADRDKKASQDRKNKRDQPNVNNHVRSDWAKFNLARMNKLIAAKPSESIYYCYRADAELTLHLSEAALRDAEHSGRLKRSSNAFACRAVAHEQLGDMAGAFANVKTALEIGPKRTGLYEILSRLERSAGHTQKAIEARTAQIKIAPKNSSFYISRADLLYATGQYQKALDDFTQALTVSNEKAIPCIYGLRGLCYLKLGKIPQAMAEANKTLKLEPNCHSGYLCRGLCYKKLGELEKATKDFEQASKISPGETDTLRAQGEIAAIAGDFEQSIQDLQNAREIDDQSRTAAITKPKSALSKRDFQKAISDYTTVINVDTLNKDAIFNRGILYLCVNNPKDALDDLKRFLKIANWQGQSSIHAALLCNIAYRKLSRDNEARLILQECKTKAKTEGLPIEFYYLAGEMSAKDALGNATDNNSATVVRCFVAMDYECKGMRQKAMDQYRWVIDNGEKNMDEYSLALSSMQRLKEPGKQPTSAINPR